MCGIFGVVGNVPRELAQQGLKTLYHRGPDGGQLWQEEGVTLGHRRLSILDLTARGTQPMTEESQRYWITYNGEVYNFLEIKEELVKKGRTFLTNSDTEVVLAAFVAWGPACLEKFNGMWALAIWDRQEKRLFLSRDRLGKKPLFYTHTPFGFAFASEMKALFPLLKEVKPNFALIKASERLFTYEGTSECLIEGITRFPAAHFAWYQEGKWECRRWWCTLDHLPKVSSRFEEQVEQFRALFLDACRLRMRSDVPLGTALSGGLDSSATFSVMAHLRKVHQLEQRFDEVPLRAFVSCFPGSPLDESVYARKVVEHTGREGVFVQVDPLRSLDSLDRDYYLFEELYVTSPIPFMQTYAAIKASGTSVTLDGHGGDELFCGYHSDILASLRDVPWWNLVRSVDVLSTYRESFIKKVTQFASPPGIMKLLWEQRRLHWRSKALIESRDRHHPLWDQLSPLNQRLYQHTHETVLPTLLRNYDRFSMSHGVEIRMPFLDHRLVSFAFALPSSSKVRHGYSRAVVRQAVASYLPPEVAFRKTKMGWSTPILDWMRGPLKSFILDTVQSQEFQTSSLVDAPKLKQEVFHLLEAPNAQYDRAQGLWALLVPFFWERAVIQRWREFAEPSPSSKIFMEYQN